MPRAITINRPDVVQLVEVAAARLTNGNKTAAIQLGMRTLLDAHARRESLFGAQKGSIRVKPGVDLTQPALSHPMDAEILPWAASLRARK